MNVKISEITKELEQVGEDGFAWVKEKYVADEREGVKKLLLKYENRYEKLKTERARVRSMQEYERSYNEYRYICGIDEVGRGPLAGPVIASAIILPKDCENL